MDDGIEILYIANNPQSTKPLLSRSCSKRKFFKSKMTKEMHNNFRIHYFGVFSYQVKHTAKILCCASFTKVLSKGQGKILS